jgi:myo-inositol-1(or 4)-monophosphatase
LICGYFGSIKRRDIQKKGLNHFVTSADKDSEKFIIKSLHKHFPSVGIYSEESGLISGKGRFLVDPLDGTHNFMHGLPPFCVSIAYEKESEMKLGVIYDPIKDELFSAEKGKGAFLNGKRIKHSGEKSPDRALIAVSIPSAAYHKRGKIMDALKNLIVEVNSIRILGSAALQLAEIAAGRIDGAIEFSLSPWDVAAGWLLIEEAGGLITDQKGGKNVLEGSIVAGTPRIHRFLLDFIQNNIIK